MLNKLKNLGPIAAVVVIAVAFGVGMYASKHSKVKDGPVEQLAEGVLEKYGIEVDFTPEDNAA